MYIKWSILVCGVEKCVRCVDDKCAECIREYEVVEEEGRTECVTEAEAQRREFGKQDDNRVVMSRPL